MKRWPVRNLILTLLFLVIQYQLWLSPYGFSMTRELKDEMNLLSNQHRRMTMLTKTKVNALIPSAKEELLEEQAREVYHYIAPDEVFIPISPKPTA